MRYVKGLLILKTKKGKNKFFPFDIETISRHIFNPYKIKAKYVSINFKMIED